MAIDWGKLRQIAKERLWTEKGVENVLTPEAKRINVCEKIKCPYAYKTSPNCSSGCRKYPVASHCHLVRGRPELKKQATQYFLHSDTEAVNVAELKIQNDSFFLDSLENRELLEIEVDCGYQTLYALYSEETFDLVGYLNQ